MKYVVEHIAQPLDSTVIADKFSVSRSKIDRDFRSATGGTLKAFVDSCRLTRAKYLLTSTDMSVTEISDAVGLFGDNYFFRFFKKHTDMTPNEYKLKYL